MPEVRFYLKKEQNKAGRCLIICKYYAGELLTISTQCRIEPEHWNPKTQRPRKSCPERDDLNKVLDRFKAQIRAADSKLRGGGKTPTPARIREELEAAGQTTAKGTEVAAYIISQARFKKPVYQSLLSHIQKFTRSTKRGKTFDEINAKWYRAFEEFLEKGDYKDNYIGQLLNALKAVVRQAVGEGLTDNAAILFIRGTFTMSTEGKIPLTLEEVIQFSAIPTADDEAARIRDAFVVACLTGLRNGDWDKLDLQNTINVGGRDFVQVFNSKTQHFIHTPLFSLTRQLLQKYGGKIKTPHRDKVNVVLKEMARQAGYTADVQRVVRRAKDVEVVNVPRWKLFSTHVGRATLNSALRATGMPDHLIQEITGHNSGSKKSMTDHYDRRAFEQKAAQMEPYLQQLESVFPSDIVLRFL